jgi:hypothetical protein
MQRVKYLRKFLLYCFRYGVEGTNPYGSPRHPDLMEVMEMFENGRTTRLQLIKEFGLTVDSYIQKILLIVKAQKVGNVKHKCLSELLMEVVETEITERLLVPEDETLDGFNSNIRWLRYLFRVNNIDMIEFLAWNGCTKTMRYMKINSIVLEGYTNAGKSLIVEKLIGVCRPEEIPRERDNSGFHLDQLPAASCALFEEPLITPPNVGTWKLLLEGKVVKTDIKHKDKEGIKRIPIWITTATPITNRVDANQSIQIEQRIQLYLFTKCIRHRRVSRNLDSELRRRVIRRAPGYITPVHFAFLWLFCFKEIQSKIAELDEEHVINKKRLRIPDSVARRCEEWQHHLRTQWNQTNQSDPNSSPADVPCQGPSRTS